MGNYSIRSGDTLSGIAQRYNTSVDALMKSNNQIKDANVIISGEKLNIPGSKDEFAPGPSGQKGLSGETGGTQQASGPEGTEAPQDLGDAPSGNVGDWIKEAQKALQAAGVPADKMNASDIAKIIEHESSGNPNAVNNWDSNAAAGHPSKGLMQTIDSTFNAHKLPGHDNIFNPVDNIIAAVRYSIDRYGSVSNVPGLQSMNGGSGYVGY